MGAGYESISRRGSIEIQVETRGQAIMLPSLGSGVKDLTAAATWSPSTERSSVKGRDQ